MAQKKGQVIVIKRITVVAGGHHGGSWKVALADFMTAMMAFFLVMWLIGQSEETKKAIADHFSTPSVIEYDFQNFGVELSLEKLFLDLVNEPLKAFQSFLEPSDKTPNLLDMGSSKVVAAFMADKLSDVAKNVEISADGFEFDIPDVMLFERGTSNPNKQFIKVLDRIKAVTQGLEEADLKIVSNLYVQSVPEETEIAAKKVASERLDLVKTKIQSSQEHTTVAIVGSISVRQKTGEVDPNKLIGFVRFSIKQKEVRSDGKKVRKLEILLGDAKVEGRMYDKYVETYGKKVPVDNAQYGQLPKKATTQIKKDASFVNPLDKELNEMKPDPNTETTE